MELEEQCEAYRSEVLACSQDIAEDLKLKVSTRIEDDNHLLCVWFISESGQGRKGTVGADRSQTRGTERR